ncbi:MAG: hypothetical protein ACYCYP_09870 [Leptospirales bacterium]
MKRIRRLLGDTLTAAALCAIFACSGNTNTTGPAPPLPTGQNGSLNLYTTTNAGCYVSDNIVCAAPPSGTAAVTALGTDYVSSSASYLLVGDKAGKVTAWTTNGTNPPATTPTPCNSGVSTPITGVAAYINGTTNDVYFVTGTTLYLNTGTSSSPCPTTTANTVTTPLPSGTVGLVVSGNTVYGITSTRQYFSVTGGATTLLSNNQSLPNIPSTASIGGVTADHNGIIFVTDHANSAIYAFYADNTTGTLTLINGTLSGNADISNPKAITTVYALNATQNYCTTGPCEFLYVTNYSNAIAQFVISVNANGASSSVGYNEFNAPYYQCEIINPIAMTSFSNAGAESGIGNTGSATVPYVYLGQNGTTSGPCFTVGSTATFGNGVTAYIPYGE